MFRFETNANEFIDSLLLRINKMSLNRSDFESIGNIIVDDAKQAIDRGEDAYGGPFVSNTSGWIKRKGNTTVFRGRTNKLFDSIRIKEIGENYVDVSVRGGGTHWQTNPGNSTRQLPQYKRVFFRITDNSRLKNKINKWLTSKN